MGSVKVIVAKEYPVLGFIGSQVNVKRGYARNFLIPKGLVVEASSRNAKQLEHYAKIIAQRRLKAKTEAENKKNELETLTLDFKLKLGKGEKAFGSITAKDVEKELLAKGFTLHKRQILLTDSLKSAGEHQVKIKLHDDVIAVVKVNIAKEEAEIKKTDHIQSKAKTRARKPKEAKVQAAEPIEEQAGTEPKEVKKKTKSSKKSSAKE